MFLVGKNTGKSFIPMGLFLDENNANAYKVKTEKHLSETLPIVIDNKLEIFNIASDVENVIIKK